MLMMVAQGFPGGCSGKELHASAGDVRETDSIPELGRCLEEVMATHSSILAWRIPQTEDSGVLQSLTSQSQTRLK